MGLKIFTRNSYGGGFGCETGIFNLDSFWVSESRRFIVDRVFHSVNYFPKFHGRLPFFS